MRENMKSSALQADNFKVYAENRLSFARKGGVSPPSVLFIPILKISLNMDADLQSK